MTSATPVTSSERIGELDVLRGFALFGVFSVHFVSALYFMYPVDEAIFAAWEQDKFQQALLVVCDILFYDKAVTLFSVLFGMGFWIQMQRLSAKNENFERLYLRRLAILVGFGVINRFLLFPGDILLDYALLGFALFFARNLSARAMLISGLAFVFLISQIAYGFMSFPWVDSDAMDQALSEALLSESYGAWVVALFDWQVSDYVIGLGAVPLAFFIFGRFLIGAWAARERLVEKARDAKPLVAKLAAMSIGAGVFFEALAVASWDDSANVPEFFQYAFHAVGVPVLAFGYAALLVRLCGSRRWDWLTGLFAPVGRMALTAYIGHGVLFLLFAHPFGIYLRPAIPPAAGFAIAVGVFLTFSFLCQAWLRRYRFGPLEWLWRSLTYGEAQPLRIRG